MPTAALPLNPPADPADLRVGFELETVGFEWTDAYDVLKKAGIPVLDEHKNRTGDAFWRVTYDGSIDNQACCELISPVNPDMAQAKKIISILQRNGAKVHDLCGLHVHVSHKNPNQPIHVRMKRPVRVWARRAADFVKKKNEPTYGDRKSIHQVRDNHVEVRLFNARLKAEYVRRRIEQVKAAVLLGPGENDWDTIVVDYQKYLAKQKQKMAEKLKTLTPKPA